MIRAVLDTNVYISALMFGGLPGYLLDLGLIKSFVLIISPALLDELEEKLRLKFAVSAEDVAGVRSKLEAIADVVRPGKVLHIIKEDPDDNRVLECAIEGNADYIITGDHHLLKLGIYKAIPILTVREFLEATELE